MRIPYFSLLALFGLYTLSAPGFIDAKVPADVRSFVGVASTIAMPDPTLTPGAVLTADVAKVCSPGFARAARHTSRAVKLAIYAAYHVAPDSGRYEIDHLVPLALGGADVAENLWPQRYGDGNAAEKDRLENFLHREVCTGKLPLREAQAEIATNWLAAYRKYLGTN